MASVYAVVQVGTHQYRVEEDTTFDVELLNDAKKGKEVKLDQVLLVGQDTSTQVGQPFVANASVVCQVADEVKQPKVISFKYKRRKGFRKKIGHRQRSIRLRVKSIVTG